MAATDTTPLDVNRAIPGLPISNILFCGLASVVVAIRIFTRTVVKNSAGWDVSGDILHCPGECHMD